MAKRVCLLVALLAAFYTSPAFANGAPGRGPAPNLAHPRPLRLPADAAMHPGASTEWWYCTGHLVDGHGRTYGFELSFIKITGLRKYIPGDPYNTVYRNDTAITDESARKFYHETTYTGARPPRAFASTTRLDIHAQTITMAALGGYRYHLQGIVPDNGRIDLTIAARRPPMLVGGNGIIPWGDGYSYYYSFTNPSATGTLTIKGRRIAVRGVAWMDHQWGNWTPASVGGWTWMGVQLDDGTDIDLAVGKNLFKRGLGSGATAILPDNRQVSVSDTIITPLGHWRSKASGVRYPMGWRVRIPKLRLDLTVQPTVVDQELVDTWGGVAAFTQSYWEGSCTVIGTRAGHRVTGKSYTEMTGGGATSDGVRYRYPSPPDRHPLAGGEPPTTTRFGPHTGLDTLHFVIGAEDRA